MQLDRRFLQDQEERAFRKVLEERWSSQGSRGMEQIWSDFKEAMHTAQSVLPPVSERDKGDWVTEEVQEVYIEQEADGLAEVDEGPRQHLTQGRIPTAEVTVQKGSRRSTRSMVEDKG